MTLFDAPFTVRFRATTADGPVDLWVGSRQLGRLDAVGRVARSHAAAAAAVPVMFAGTIVLGEADVRHWMEHVRRVRHVAVDADALLAVAERELARHGDAAAARAVIEHVLGWASVRVRVASGDPVPARLAPGSPSTGEWDDEPWAYRSGDVPRRANPRKLPLHAPEFDIWWSNEYRAVLMVAPPGRDHNSIPLLATYVRPWSYEPAFWDWEIVQILRDASGTVPKDALALDDWYPRPNPPRPEPTDDVATWSTWTSRRLLDGFSGLPLQRETGTDRYVMEIDWSDVGAHGAYELPNVAIFWQGSAGAFRLVGVEIAARRWWWGRGPLPDGWRREPQRYFEVRMVRPEDGERVWQHALFVARSSVLLAGEVDVHLARTHLVAEGYALMLAVHGQAKELEPVRRLLAPFLRDVSGINRLGDALVMGRNGVLVAASGLGPRAMQRRLARQTATTDWKGFAPRGDHPLLGAEARYPRAAQAFWRGITAMVHDQLEQVAREDRGALVAGLAAAIEAHDDRFTRSPGRVLAPRPGAGFVWPAEWQRQLDPRQRRISLPRSFADVEQLCAYVIFHATFVHGWVNDEAWVDGGSLRHAVFGLRDLDPPAPGQAWDDWWRDVGPGRKHAAMQLSVGWTLDRLSWGTMSNPYDDTRRETDDKAAHGELEVVRALWDAMHAGNPSPAAELAAIDRPLETWRIRINS